MTTEADVRDLEGRVDRLEQRVADLEKEQAAAVEKAKRLVDSVYPKVGFVVAGCFVIYHLIFQ